MTRLIRLATAFRVVAIGLVAIVGLVVSPRVGAGDQRGEKSAGPGVAAKVGDQVITIEELEQSLTVQLARLQEQRYQLLQSKLDELIEERLLGQEAKRRGVTAAALVKAEIVSKVPEVTDAEITMFMNENKARLKGDAAELRPRVRDYLTNERVALQRRAYVAGLRQKFPVEVLLKEPEPVRMAVKVDGAFAKGPKDAPVTIVEFSDFHCPFCRGAVATLNDVMRQFPGKVRWVYRDFPIASLHPQAAKAAEAARCAGEQGKFWEYHDVLFESQQQTTLADFKRFADQLKLEPKGFAACLESGRYQAAVQLDIEDGVRLGISGTPTFFVNGRLLVGNQPVDNFKKIIEAELRQKGS
jgi:protein-disulfide isomerase